MSEYKLWLEQNGLGGAMEDTYEMFKKKVEEIVEQVLVKHGLLIEIPHKPTPEELAEIRRDLREAAGKIKEMECQKNASG